MRFYNRQHRHYCGIDLHVKTMYICILDAAGQVLVHRNAKSTPQAFSRRSPHTATIWLWPRSACSHGTGLRISVPPRRSRSCWDMPSR